MLVASITSQLARRDFLFSDHEQVLTAPEDLCTIRAQNCALFLLTNKTYKVIGEPTDVDGARELATTDPFQFQAWALGLVGARVATSDRRGGDKGIDGRLYFHDEGAGKSKQIIFSVKAGHLVPNFVRDLRGVIDREEAEIGVLLTFEQPSAGMRAEAAEAGFYVDPWGNGHARIQILTVGELLAGKAVDYPHLTGGNVTHQRAPRAAPSADQSTLDL